MKMYTTVAAALLLLLTACNNHHNHDGHDHHNGEEQHDHTNPPNRGVQLYDTTQDVFTVPPDSLTSRQEGLK